MNSVELSARFERAFREHVESCVWVAKVQSQKLLKKIDEKGPFPTAKENLGLREFLFGRLFDIPHPFFQAMSCRDRIDLTIEAFVLSPEWQDLFTQSELETARRRLEAHGFVLPEGSFPAKPIPRPVQRQEQSLLTTSFHLEFLGLLADNRDLASQLSEIETNLAAGKEAPMHASHRSHLQQQPDAANKFPNALRQYDMFDRQFCEMLTGLLKNLEAALAINEKRVHEWTQREYESPFDDK